MTVIAVIVGTAVGEIGIEGVAEGTVRIVAVEAAAVGIAKIVVVEGVAEVAMANPEGIVVAEGIERPRGKNLKRLLLRQSRIPRERRRVISDPSASFCWERSSA